MLPNNREQTPSGKLQLLWPRTLPFLGQETLGVLRGPQALFDLLFSWFYTFLLSRFFPEIKDLDL